MTKTLAAIINHNARAYTDQLYAALNPYRREDYDIMVLDNGSTRKDEISQYTTHVSNVNTYYGGALNLIFREFLSMPQYDSVMVFNNDLILHGYNFIKIFREEMYEVTPERHYWKVLSPCVLQPEKTQCYWKHMHNWGSSTIRPVRWIDFMCPFIDREVVEKIQSYDSDLQFGWGQDIYTGVVCENNDWNIGVIDRLSVIHLASQTYKENRSDITASEYGNKAMNGMTNYFDKIGMTDILQKFRNYGTTYTWGYK